MLVTVTFLPSGPSTCLSRVLSHSYGPSVPLVRSRLPYRTTPPPSFFFSFSVFSHPHLLLPFSLSTFLDDDGLPEPAETLPPILLPLTALMAH